jgi:hypothetical protein
MGRELHVTMSIVVQECNSCSSTCGICNFVAYRLYWEVTECFYNKGD